MAKANAYPTQRVTPEQAREAVLETGSLKAAAEKLGVHRRTVQHQLDNGRKSGGVERPKAEANPSRWRPGAEIVAARKSEFERVKRAGDGRTPTVVHLADDGPFCVVFLGDPHLDSPGTDLDLWERWIAPLNYRKHIHGFGLGDWLDQWVKPLAYLYGASETPAPEGWILLNHYLDQIGEHLIGSCSGNHEDWAGYNNVIDGLMEKHGIPHRSHGISLTLRGPSGREVSIGARHTYPGRSIWNPAHGVMRAAMLGRRQTILVAGHTHVSGEARVKHDDTGTFTWAIQTASFKIADEYADQLGLTDKHASPAVAAVIDPSRLDTDPQLVTLFHDPDAAVGYLNSLRRRK